MKKRGIRLAALVLAAAVLLTVLIRISLNRQDEKNEREKASLGEMLAEADRKRQGGTEEETADGTEGEEGIVTLNWAFTEAGGENLKPYETALNAELKKKGLPWRVSFTALGISMTNGLAGPLSEKRQLEQGKYDMISCVDFGYFCIYDILAGEGLLEPLDARLKETEEGKRLWEAYPPVVWDSVRAGGEVYGVPTVITTTRYYLIVNEEMEEKYQVDLEDLTPEKAEQAIRRVTDGERVAGNAGFLGGEFPDWLAGVQQTPLPFLRVFYGEDGSELENILENEAYLADRKRELELFSDGYLLRQDTGQVKAGNFFLMGIRSYSEAAAKEAFRCRWEVPETVPIRAFEFTDQDETLYSGGRKAGIWADSDKKDEAFSLLAAIYSDEALSNAMTYGTYGTDYQIKDGKVMEEAGDGGGSYGGNPLLTLPGKEDSERKREELLASIEAKKPTAVPRLDFDPREVLKEWVELQEIYMEQWADLCHCDGRNAGPGEKEICNCAETWEEDLERVRAAVKEAGIDRVMEYMEKAMEENSVEKSR